MDDANIASRLSEEDKTTVRNACSNAIKWLSENEHATEEQYAHKKQEIENICKPVAVRLYSAAGGAFPQGPGAGRQFPRPQDDNNNSRGGGPVIDEVD